MFYCCCSEKDTGPVVEEAPSLIIPVSQVSSLAAVQAERPSLAGVSQEPSAQTESLRAAAARNQIHLSLPSVSQDVPLKQSKESASKLTLPIARSLSKGEDARSEVEIILFKNGPFGLDMGKDTFSVLRVKEGSVVDLHNKNSPVGKQLLPGHTIVAVNGVRGSSMTLVSEIARASGKTTLIVRQGYD
mmetsp:Transcript_43261/g.94247  ORF Transcript_43261/g.94247 Transcript_43261/m.94247 type:complete len:188 (+) Transcript_43261:3-566(+)